MMDAFVIHETGWTWSEYMEQPDRLVTALLIYLNGGAGIDTEPDPFEAQDTDIEMSLPMEAI